ncbi:MAG: hypothetical protein ACE5Z5_14785 [Candidatus Bathyarchaeia archaeon]
MDRREECNRHWMANALEWIYFDKGSFLREICGSCKAKTTCKVDGEA